MARSSNILEEYLVGLGFALDTVGFTRFQSMLRDAEHLSNTTNLSMVKGLIGLEAAAVSAFGALGMGVLTFAEKTAMADQEYRLLALRMYTSLPVARELKVALDALGQPLENVIWDPELARRFSQLVQDQKTMTKELGPDFENQMLKIRDVRFEFTRFGVELKYLSMLVVKDLAQVFGMSMDQVLDKLRKFNEYMLKNMPEIADTITMRLKPVLESVGGMFTVLKDDAIIFRDVFIHFMGLLTNDAELKNSTGNWKDFAKAVQEAALALANTVTSILKIGGNLGLLVDAGLKASHKDFKGALADLYKMSAIETENAPKAAGAMTGVGAGMVKQAIVAQATALGVPPELALAVAQVESGFRQYDKSGNLLVNRGLHGESHATGIFQLQPATARALRVNPADTSENIRGGVTLLKQLLDAQHGNVLEALEKYYGGAKFDTPEARKYAQDVMATAGGIHIENLTVTVHGNGDPQAIKSAVKDGISEAERQRVQRAIAEFGTLAWGPG